MNKNIFIYIICAIFIIIGITFFITRNKTKTYSPDNMTIVEESSNKGEKEDLKDTSVNSENVDSIHNSQNSLDIKGVYYGILPCASCSGIETMLTLKNNSEYELSTLYQEKDSLPSNISGKYKWKNGSTISLEGIKQGTRPTDYKVEENKLRQLDMFGNVIKGDLDSNYILLKSGNFKVENKKWQLIELNGKEIKGDVKDYFITFNSSDSSYSSKAGCNNIGGKYIIVNEFKFKSFGGFSTMMACPDMDTETNFTKNLELADNISISEDGMELSLNKARMAPLSKFKLIK